MSLKSCLAPKDTRAESRIRFGVSAESASLPLKAVHCDAKCEGPVALVTVAQLYVNEQPHAIHVRYTFPLPSDAAVYSCEMWVGSKRIVAKVKPDSEAREQFKEQVAQGRHAVLVESVRKNIFTMDLGNVQPGEEVEIKLSYLDILEQSAEQETRVSRLRIPLCPGIPYIPGKPLLRSSRGLGVPDTDQVPDASRITPPRIDADDSRAAALSIRIAAPASGTLTSPTHKINVTPVSGTLGESDYQQLGLDMEQYVPDRDFIAEWRQSGVEIVTALRRDAHALLTLAAPVQSIRAAALNQDIYFLVDRSGSMEGIKWAKSLEALKRFVAVLGDQDKIDIVFFESGFSRFSDELETRKTILSDPKFRSLEKHLAPQGGTELMAPLSDMLERIKASPTGRLSTIVLITDGQVGNSQPILDLLANSPDIIVHTFGIDTAVNDTLLKEIARQQKGWCVLKTPKEDIAGAVQILAERVASPAYTEVKLDPPFTSVGRIPPLYCGDVLAIPLKLDATDEVPELKIHATNRDGVAHSWTVPVKRTTSLALELLWAKEQIDDLLRNKKGEAAVKLACQYNLSCPGAAWVAWDDVAHEKAGVLINQPSVMPDQWDMVAGGAYRGLPKPLSSPAQTGSFPRMASYAPLPPPSPVAAMPMPSAPPAQDLHESMPAPGSRRRGGGGSLAGGLMDLAKSLLMPKPEPEYRSTPPPAAKAPAPTSPPSESGRMGEFIDTALIAFDSKNSIQSESEDNSFDLDLLAWENNIRRLALFQGPENLPLLEKLLKWAAKASLADREKLYKKLVPLQIVEQLASVEAVLKS